MEHEAALASEAARKTAEELVDHAPSVTPPEKESISAEELRNLNLAVSSLKSEGDLNEEKAELEELKEEREEYVEVSAEQVGVGVVTVCGCGHRMWQTLQRNVMMKL